MRKLYVGVAFLFFVLFFSTSAIGQQGKTQASTDNPLLLSMLTLEDMDRIDAELLAAEKQAQKRA